MEQKPQYFHLKKKVENVI